MELATADLFRAKWTQAIHDEWVRNLLVKRPDLSEEKLRHVCDLMNRGAEDCLVEGYEPLIPALTLPDPDDRHVLAAAVHSRADATVTFNLRDFPRPALERVRVEALHPDDFICCQFDLHEAAVVVAAQRCRRRLKAPPQAVEKYLATLSRQPLPKTVAALRPYAAIL